MSEHTELVTEAREAAGLRAQLAAAAALPGAWESDVDADVPCRDQADRERVRGHIADLRAVLTDPAAALAAVRAEAWDEGMRTGASRAMRHMSDEPNLPLASDADNPYRADHIEADQ